MEAVEKLGSRLIVDLHGRIRDMNKALTRSASVGSGSGDCFATFPLGPSERSRMKLLWPVQAWGLDPLMRLKRYCQHSFDS